MKKFKLSIFASLVTIAVMFTAACSSSSETQSNDSSSNDNSTESEETITLRVTSGLSAQHGWWQGFFVPWMEQVEAETNGRVQFETFTSGELVEATHELDGIRQGIADIAAPLLPIYDPQRFPMAEITMLPLTHSDTLIASRAFKRLVESDVPIQDGKTFYEIEFTDKGLFALALPTTQEYSISTTGHEFNAVNDVVGTTLRTPSRIHEMYAESIGVGTVTMAAIEMFDAMSRGAFEGSFYSIADWTGYGFQDLFTYTLQGVNFGHFNSFFAMTEDKWNSIPEDIQAVMLQVAEDQFEPAAQEWINRSDEIRAYSLENGGKFVDFETLDQEVQEHFVTGIEDTWFQYIDLVNERGANGTELVKLWRDLLIEEGGSVPEGVMDIE
ncbi:type 2 periplasmic-binding domain-containing protein [Alkalihalobacterium elongatum]|uniref:TRAP transporter substrate-binding protein DctP n=1 Tax=Alkalihalobacterium elongatum TaxID=2675466 RepID=UPI001C1FA1B2|nr:TRAP transporter substrate-binding protein DctP [Alkalihalobacterium elongatum]